MSLYGPQVFEIELSDSFRTFNPIDPLVGIDVTAVVGVSIHWNLARTELVPRNDLNEKDVTFSPTKWQGAGAGPHDVYEKKIDDRFEKIGTVLWSVTVDYFKVVQPSDDKFRWLVTPCPVLFRTFTPTGGSPQITEVLKQPVPCPGNWMKIPREVQQAMTESAHFTAQLKQEIAAPTRHKISVSTKQKS